MVQDRRKSVPLFCRIEVSAFAAVMFALLIFFAAREAARNPISLRLWLTFREPPIHIHFRQL